MLWDAEVEVANLASGGPWQSQMANGGQAEVTARAKAQEIDEQFTSQEV